eukprot:124565_1
MVSGIKTKDTCIDLFNQIKMDKSLQYVTFKIDGDNIAEDVVMKKGGSTYAEFVKTMGQGPRFVVYDYDYKTEEVPPREVSRLIFFFWCPDTAPVKAKMMYSSSKEDFKSKLVGIHKYIDVQDISSLDEKEVVESLRKL